MKDLQYLECQNCGNIHYVVSEEEAKTLKESGALYDEFSERNLECCAQCGSKNRFLTISETYANDYLQGDKIPPILLKNEESKGTNTNT